MLSYLTYHPSESAVIAGFDGFGLMLSSSRNNISALSIFNVRNLDGIVPARVIIEKKLLNLYITVTRFFIGCGFFYFLSGKNQY
jgi:hypothetical protein